MTDEERDSRIKRDSSTSAFKVFADWYEKIYVINEKWEDTSYEVSSLLALFYTCSLFK